MRVCVLMLFCIFSLDHFSYSQCQNFKEEYIEPAWKLKENDPDQALEIINRGINLIKKTKTDVCKEFEDTAYLLRGFILRNKEQYDKARQDFDIAFDIRKNNKDTIDMVKVLNAYSSNEKEQGNYKKALEYSIQAIELLNQFSSDFDKTTLASAHLTAATTLIESDSFSLQKVKGYIDQAISIYEKTEGDQSAGKFNANYNLAIAYRKKGLHPKAQKLFNKCLDHYTKSEDTLFMALIENELGLVQQETANYSSAKKHFENSFHLFGSLQDTNNINLPLLNLARNYIKENKPRLAIKSAENIQLKKSRRLEDQALLQRIYIDAYKQLGDLEKIVIHLEKMDTINQKIFEESYYPYPIEDKEKLENLLMQSLVKNERNIATAIIVGILLIIIFYLLIKAEQKRTQEQRIDSENQSQEKKFQEKIADILKGYRKEFAENRIKLNGTLHDIICPRIINIKREIEYYMTNKNEEVLKEAMKFSDNLYKDARALINKEEILPYQTEWLQNILLLINQQKRIGAFEVNEHFDVKLEDIPPEIGNQVALITNVLLENIEKWAKAKQASISIIKENGSLMMVIDDDGVGFSEDNITQKEGHHNSGIGLKNVRYRVEKMKGNLKIDSRIGEGTAITIKIPLK